MDLGAVKPEVFKWYKLIGCEVLIDGRQDWIVGIPRYTSHDYKFYVKLLSGEKVYIFDCMLYIDNETLVCFAEFYKYFYGEE